MRILSYRNKRRFKKLLIFLTVLICFLLSFCVIRFIYLQRYLVYADHQVTLDFGQDLEHEPQPEVPGWMQQPIEIITEDPLVQTTPSTDQPMRRLRGYYITTDMLLNMEEVTKAMNSLEDVDTVLIDLKSIAGYFYYSSGTYGAVTSSADILAIDAMIETLAANPEIYLIGRIASLSDNNFALSHQDCGLPLRSGALWMDRHGCYWLNPMAAAVQEYLASIAEELSIMGFDEIVFDQFQIPTSENIVYRSEFTREEAAAEAAKSICTMLETMPIRVSFNSTNAMVASYSDRIYLESSDGSTVASLVDGIKENLEDPSSQIVFLTASRDTRFDEYGVLRPLIEARVE